VACGLVSCLTFAVSHWGVSLAEGLLLMGTAAAIIVCLTRLGENARRSPFGWVAWAGLAFAISEFAIGYVVSFAFAFRNPGIAVYGQWGLVKAIAELSPFENGWWLAVHLYTAVVPLVLGALAFNRLRRPSVVRSGRPRRPRSHLARESMS
jgi:hypothetical protein